ncbi:MAG TPA: Maf family protein [Chthoniobacterales bacterium]
MKRFILASGSPQRIRLLQEARYDFIAQPASIAELAVDFLTPGELTLLNACRKTFAVARAEPNAVVLGADTLVALGTTMFGKPADLDEARRMLAQLSGRTHEVLTGLAISSFSEQRTISVVVESAVRFRELNADFIDRYLSRIDPLRKAGAYAAQIDPETVIERIDGSFTNVVGLPMETVSQLLAEFGIHPSG